MANFLRLVAGVAYSFSESSSLTIYDQPLTVVATGATGTNQVNGPVTAGTNVALPASGTYVGAELEIRYNGQRLEQLFDYNYVGTGSKTQIVFTFDLAVGDRFDFRVDRAP